MGWGREKKKQEEWSSGGLKSWREMVEKAKERNLFEDIIVNLIINLSTHPFHSKKTFDEIYKEFVNEAIEKRKEK